MVNIDPYNVHPTAGDLRELLQALTPSGLFMPKFQRLAHNASYEHLIYSVANDGFSTWEEFATHLRGLEAWEETTANAVAPELWHVADSLEFFDQYPDECDTIAGEMDYMNEDDTLTEVVARSAQKVMEFLTADEFRELCDRVLESNELAALIEREGTHDDDN